MNNIIEKIHQTDFKENYATTYCVLKGNMNWGLKQVAKLFRKYF